MLYKNLSNFTIGYIFIAVISTVSIFSIILSCSENSVNSLQIALLFQQRQVVKRNDGEHETTQRDEELLPHF